MYIFGVTAAVEVVVVVAEVTLSQTPATSLKRLVGMWYVLR
jgi:hypothetical protein